MVVGDMSISEKDQLLDEVRQAIKELQSDWYSFAIELGIDYGTRRVRSAIDCLKWSQYYINPVPPADHRKKLSFC